MTTRNVTPAALATALLVLAGCVPGEGPSMDPGADCLRCHDGDEARRWTAAGTWGGQGRSVSFRDAAGRSFSVSTNQAGNFFTAEPLSFPLQVSVDGEAMSEPVTYGGCNSCHSGGGEGEGD